MLGRKATGPRNHIHPPHRARCRAWPACRGVRLRMPWRLKPEGLWETTGQEDRTNSTAGLWVEYSQYRRTLGMKEPFLMKSVKLWTATFGREKWEWNGRDWKRKRCDLLKFPWVQTTSTAGQPPGWRGQPKLQWGDLRGSPSLSCLGWTRRLEGRCLK